MLKVKDYSKRDLAIKIVVILLQGITGAMALNYFLVPANVFSTGVTGIAQISHSFFVNLGIQSLSPIFNTGILIFIFNIPIFILGFLKLGKSAMLLSFANMSALSVCTTLIPVGEITDNVLMNAIAGGVLFGVGVGFSLKYGFTTGGLDIISLLLSNKTGRTAGDYMMVLNGVIVVIAGFFFSWESALYTIITIFTMSTVVDRIHTRHQKLTAFITTKKPEELRKVLGKSLVRGMTMMSATGGFSSTELDVIMIVFTRYELYTLKQLVQEVDATAFTNIIATDAVVGSFLNEKEQARLRSAQ